jgi:hypothetical protein
VQIAGTFYQNPETIDEEGKEIPALKPLTEEEVRGQTWIRKSFVGQCLFNSSRVFYVDMELWSHCFFK